MARRLFVIFVIATLTGENYLASGYSAGSLIWSRSKDSFIPVESVSAFQAARKVYLMKSRELEIHDFQTEEVRLAFYEEENMLHFYENDTRVTGVYGEIWNVLAEHLNFTLVTIKTRDSHYGIKLPNGSYDGLLGMLTRNEIHVIPRSGSNVTEAGVISHTTPVAYSSYRLFVRPESKFDNNWIFKMFSRKVWYSILLLFVFMSVIGYTMQRTSIGLSRDNSVHDTLHDHLFHTFATFCCQGFVPDSLYHRTKIHGFSMKMFAWLLLIIVSCNLISRMTNRKVQPPFEDLNTMLNNTNYTVVVFNGSVVYGKFKAMVRKFEGIDRYNNRFLYVNSPRSLYEKACRENEEYAILDTEERERAYGRLQCNLMAIGKSYYTSWITAVVSKTFKYKKTLDLGILKLNEFGLTAGLKNRWMPSNVINVDLNVKHAVYLDQVSMLFTILCAGMIASVVIFVLESVFFSLPSR